MTNSNEQKSLIVAKITSKNQVTIPKPIRQKLGVHSYDQLAFEIKSNGDILIKKQPEKADFWSVVAEQTEKYGAYDDEEVDWGADLGSEVIDE